MNKEKNMDHDAPFLDIEEQDLIESLNSAIDQGKFTPSNAIDQQQKQDFWMKTVENTEKRKAITLRIQQRDIYRLKVLARRKGLPYQTFISSSLHQLANGDLIER